MVLKQDSVPTTVPTLLILLLNFAMCCEEPERSVKEILRLLERSMMSHVPLARKLSLAPGVHPLERSRELTNCVQLSVRSLACGAAISALMS